MRRSRFTSIALSSALSGARSSARSLGLAGLVTVALAGCPEADTRPAEFPYLVATILRPGCATATCHDAATKRVGYDFSTVEAAGEAVDFDLVPIGGSDEPDTTTLIRILTDSGDDRMPIDAPLPDADIALLRTWIAEGAVH